MQGKNNLNQFFSESFGHGFGLAVHMQFFVNIFYMASYCFGRKKTLRRNDTVAFALCEASENIQLPGR